MRMDPSPHLPPPPPLQGMRACLDSGAVQKQACGALSIFAVHSALPDAAKRHIADVGGIAAMVRAVQAYPDDGPLVVAALKALSTLVGVPELRAVARAAGTAEAVETLLLMDEHRGSREVGDLLRGVQRKLATTGGAGAAAAPAAGGGGGAPPPTQRAQHGPASSGGGGRSG